MNKPPRDLRSFVDQQVARMKLGEDEYIAPSDGLIHCKHCGKPRQVVLGGLSGRPCLLPSCLCPCQQEAERQYAEEDAQRQRLERIRRRKARGLQDVSLYDDTFTHDNGTNPLMAKARAYVEHWEEAYAKGAGLLLFGDVGTGKSFFAGCIANALLDRDVPVLMTGLPMLIHRMTGMPADERLAFLNGLNSFQLLVIDDLGIERGSPYVMEQVFLVIDGRYRCRKPMIVTTNLTLQELKNPSDLAHARIYDRILERCAPILFDGGSLRKENTGETKDSIRRMME